MAAASKGGWAEEVEEQDKVSRALPEPKVTVADGIKTVVSYSRNEDGKIQKVTQKFKIEIQREKLTEAMAERRKWPKFGAAKGLPSGPSPATTTLAEEVELKLRSKSEQAKQEEPETAPKAANVSCRLCRGAHYTHSCPFKDILSEKGGEEGEAPGAEGDGAAAAAPAAESAWKKTGKYVPPQKAGGGSGGGYGGGGGDGPHKERDDSATVRVTNLSDTVTESDIRDLFRKAGRIFRVFLSQSKGFAYVTFNAREEAEKAVAMLEGHRYDHLILHVELSNKGRDGPRR